MIHLNATPCLSKVSSESVTYQLSQSKHDVTRNSLLILHTFHVFSIT